MLGVDPGARRVGLAVSDPLGLTAQGLETFVRGRGSLLAHLEALARDYALERRQFDAPIASFQAIQWMIADSVTELDAAKLLVLRAAWLKEQGKIFTRDGRMVAAVMQEGLTRYERGYTPPSADR